MEHALVTNLLSSTGIIMSIGHFKDILTCGVLATALIVNVYTILKNHKKKE